MGQQRGIQIPVEQLAEETLRGVIEEFVTRDGTELSEATTKVAQVRELLRRGEAELWYDAKTRTCNIITKAR